MPRNDSSSARAVLWDLDGTLVDSAGLHWRAWVEVLEANGLPLDTQYFTQAFGKRNDVILRGLLGDEADSTLIDELGLTKEARYRELLGREGVRVLPGAADWLARLRARGWRQVLATSAPLANVEAVLASLDWRDRLDGWVSADEVGVGKPDPAVFLAASARAGAAPDRCVVVEDAPAGILGARRAGMRSVGVRSAYHADLDADLVVDSLEQLRENSFEELLVSR